MAAILKALVFTESQHLCGLPSTPYRTRACPNCGFDRCMDCIISKVGASEEQKPFRPKVHAPRPSKCRKGLPLAFHTESGTREIITRYDTGTHDNHMTLTTAQELGYMVNMGAHDQHSFRLPNGKVIESIGRVAAQVQFVSTTGKEGKAIECAFHVFERLAVPVLIGMTFLQATETLTKFTSRLQDLPSASFKGSLKLCAMGDATNRVTCMVNGRWANAHADTGSDIALVSGAFAAQHGLLQEYSCEELELADGSVEYTSGFADVRVTVRDPDNWGLKTSRTVRVHVLKHLHVKVLLDEDTVEDFRIFQDGLSQVFAAATQSIGMLAPIVHLRSVEQAVARMTERVKDWASSVSSSDKKPESKPQEPGMLRATKPPVHSLTYNYRLWQPKNRRTT